MKTYRTMIVLAVIAIATGFARAADVAGKWKSEFESPIGQLKYTYDLKADGTNLTGKAIRTLEGATTETEIKEGKVNDDEVSFVEPLKLDDQDVRIEYKGKLAGDEIKFTRKVGDFATMEIVAKREKVPAAAGGVAGQWQAEFDTQIGQQKYTFTFKTDGDVLTGKANAEIGGEKYSTEIKEGKLKGEEISFVEPLKFQETELRLEYKGKMSGDEIKLTRKVGDVATEELVAKRVKQTEQTSEPKPAAAKP